MGSFSSGSKLWASSHRLIHYNQVSVKFLHSCVVVFVGVLNQRLSCEVSTRTLSAAAQVRASTLATVYFTPSLSFTLMH